jgi:hypothetical protein
LTEYEKTAAPELLAEYREAFAAASAARLGAQVDPAAAG